MMVFTQQNGRCPFGEFAAGFLDNNMKITVKKIVCHLALLTVLLGVGHVLYIIFYPRLPTPRQMNDIVRSRPLNAEQLYQSIAKKSSSNFFGTNDKKQNERSFLMSVLRIEPVGLQQNTNPVYWYHADRRNVAYICKPPSNAFWYQRLGGGGFGDYICYFDKDLNILGWSLWIVE